MRWMFALVLVAGVGMVAGCRPAPTNNRIDPNIVQWDHSPTTIVFRADVIGGESDFRARNAIPNCTIYGDDRVVWVNELGPFQVQVLEDRLPDAQISAYAQYLAANERIYTYDAHLSDVETQSAVSPVAETVTINVNNTQHQADSFSGWDSNWFPTVLAACKGLSKAPVLVAPSSGWLSAEKVDFSMSLPLATWDEKAMGLSLDAVTGGSPRWMSGNSASQLWNTLHSLPSNLIFQDGTDYYAVALQVPGITRDAPAAPS